MRSQLICNRLVGRIGRIGHEIQYRRVWAQHSIRIATVSEHNFNACELVLPHGRF